MFSSPNLRKSVQGADIVEIPFLMRPLGQELHQSMGSTMDRAEVGLDGEASAGAWRAGGSGLGCWHQDGVSGPRDPLPDLGAVMNKMEKSKLAVRF